MNTMMRSVMLSVSLAVMVMGCTAQTGDVATDDQSRVASPSTGASAQSHCLKIKLPSGMEADDPRYPCEYGTGGGGGGGVGGGSGGAGQPELCAASLISCERHCAFPRTPATAEQRASCYERCHAVYDLCVSYL
jgi:hypothetical protein